MDWVLIKEAGEEAMEVRGEASPEELLAISLAKLSKRVEKESCRSLDSGTKLGSREKSRRSENSFPLELSPGLWFKEETTDIDIDPDIDIDDVDGTECCEECPCIIDC